MSFYISKLQYSILLFVINQSTNIFLSVGRIAEVIWKAIKRNKTKFVSKLQNEETSVRKFRHFCKTLRRSKYSFGFFIVLGERSMAYMNKFLPTSGVCQMRLIYFPAAGYFPIPFICMQRFISFILPMKDLEMVTG